MDSILPRCEGIPCTRDCKRRIAIKARNKYEDCHDTCDDYQKFLARNEERKAELYAKHQLHTDIRGCAVRSLLSITQSKE